MNLLPLPTALKLGRVSNLPTVWTNVLAGLALGGGAVSPSMIAALVVGASLLYVAGMYLNDAFDRQWDAQHRPERPIPAGEVRAEVVFAAGFAMLAVGVFVLAGADGRLFRPAVALALLIVVYDINHKDNPAAPALMALCRVGLYMLGALAANPTPGPRLYIGSALLFAYLITLTVLARRETSDPRLPQLVGLLIAGICLLDAAILAALGRWTWAGAAVTAFLLTRRLQRRIAGT